LLEVIASGVASTPADVQRYARCTFYVSSKAQEDSENTQKIIANTVAYLERNEFITLRRNEDAETKVQI
jgi:DNA polymerase theta